MSDFLEATVLLLPPEAGGRTTAVEPRAGSYWPFVRVGTSLVRVRVIEGPARLAPGDAARVMLECESCYERLRSGAELQVIEHDRVVGHLTVLRVWHDALAS